MVDSARSGAVVDEGAAGTAELVVERDGCGEADHALQDAFSQAGEGACAVAFEGEDVFAGPEDAFDALTNRCEMRTLAGFVAATRPDDRGVQVADGLREGAAGVALVAEQGLAAVAPAAREQLQRDASLVGLGRRERDRAWCAVGREDGVQSKSPEVSAVTGTPAVIRCVAQRGATDRFAALRARDGRAVDEQQIVVKARALAGEDAEQPLQRVDAAAATLEVAGLLRQLGKQVPKPLARDGEKPAIRWDAHDRLRDAQRDDLRVCDSSGGVRLSVWQEIVGGAEHRREQQVEVGVHRGPHRSAMRLRTADFDPAAPNSSTNTGQPVESTI